MGAPLPVTLDEPLAPEPPLSLGLGALADVLMARPSGPSACWTSQPGAFQPNWDFTALADCGVEMRVAALAYAGLHDGGLGVSTGYGHIHDAPIDVAPVPLPSAAVLLATGLALVALIGAPRRLGAEW